MIEEQHKESGFEVLLIDEFAERLQVSRSTIFDWKSNGTLIPGHHYFQKGKVLRFIWARDLVLDIHQNEGLKQANDSHVDADVQHPEHSTPRRRGVAINLDY